MEPHPPLTTSTDPPPSLLPPPPPAVASGVANHNASSRASLTQNVKLHPPYAEMIYAAITALKERGGSSKRAIAKYIQTVYKDLPPAHSSLLNHHLKRLKNSGRLVMVKKSYKIPRSANLKNSAAVLVPTSSTPSGEKKGRGRPPKPKPALGGLRALDKKPAGRPRKNGTPGGRGRPRKTVPTGVALGVNGVKRSPGRPRKTGTTVGRGRPRKTVPVVAVLGVDGVKKGRGRPPKAQSMSKVPFASTMTNSPRPRGRPKKAEALAVNGVKKGPGRPPKTQSVARMLFPSAKPNSPRPRGRPKKAAAAGGGAPAVAAPSTAAGGAVLGKRRGRPPKIAGVKKPKSVYRPTGRTVGRPKKNPSN